MSVKNLIQKIINLISPDLVRKARIYKLKRILYANPQVSSDGLKFWGAQVYEDYEPNIYKVLMRLMGRCNVFVNVGANHGIYCLRFSSVSEAVFAFEAFPDNLNILMKNIKQNRLEKKVYVYPVAVGSTESLVTFFGASSGGSLLKGWNQQIDHGITVPLHSIDALLYHKFIEINANPLFLIDVEGAEYEVVKGVKKIIRDIPGSIFCIEIPCREFMPDEVFNPHFVDIFNYFFKSGFFAWEIDSHGNLHQLDSGIVKKFVESARYNGVMAVFSKNNINEL